MYQVDSICASNAYAPDVRKQIDWRIISAEAGTIEPGKSAGIIAVSGDPLADVKVLKKVEFVMARGEVVTSTR